MIPVPNPQATQNPTTQTGVITTGGSPNFMANQQTPLQTGMALTSAPNPIMTSAGTPFQSQAQTRTAQNPGQQAFYDNLPTYYPGQTVAGMNQVQRDAYGNIINTATSQQGMIDGVLGNVLTNTTQNVGVSDRMNSALDFSLGGLLEQGNPYLEGVINAATRPITENFTQQVLPQLGSAAQRQGAWGGSRQGIVEGLAAGETAKAVGDTAAGLSYDAYNRALGLLETGMGAELNVRGQDIQQQQMQQNETLSRLGLIPGLMGAQYVPSQMLDAVGGDLRAYDQQIINADIDRHNYGQNADAARLAQYASLLPGASTNAINNSGGSTTTNTSPVNTPSRTQNAIGGAAAGATIGSMTGFENGGGWGALVGLLAGAFS